MSNTSSPLSSVASSPPESEQEEIEGSASPLPPTSATIRPKTPSPTPSEPSSDSGTTGARGKKRARDEDDESYDEGQTKKQTQSVKKKRQLAPSTDEESAEETIPNKAKETLTSTRKTAPRSKNQPYKAGAATSTVKKTSSAAVAATKSTSKPNTPSTSNSLNHTQKKSSLAPATASTSKDKAFLPSHQALPLRSSNLAKGSPNPTTAKQPSTAVAGAKPTPFPSARSLPPAKPKPSQSGPSAAMQATTKKPPAKSSMDMQNVDVFESLFNFGPAKSSPKPHPTTPSAAARAADRERERGDTKSRLREGISTVAAASNDQMEVDAMKPSEKSENARNQETETAQISPSKPADPPKYDQTTADLNAIKISF
ncbi:hypothetical protein BT69DRAFT_435374 [Atractiella rhizophila]|nr:hypothetical protein BT69DRAFT_435374 [Atractiella rhizophila]